MPAIHEALDRFWSSLSSDPVVDVPETTRMQFTTALIEIASNMATHAHPPGHPRGQIELTLTAMANRIEAHLRDHGIPFDPDAITHLADDPAMPSLAETGRGLTIAHLVLDELHYTREDATNHWRLVKRLTG